MKVKVFATAAISLFVLSGCASTKIYRGHVIMKTADAEAHVATGPNEMVVGDHVELYQNQCTPGGSKINGPRVCRKISNGHGEVTSVISPDYVSVKFPPGTTFQEGDTIEKHAH